MSSGLASRLKHPKKHDLVKSQSQAQLLANKLRQDGVMVAVEGVLQAVDQVAALLASNIQEINYKDSIINLCQHLKVYGAYLEILYKEQLDHAFKIFRDKAQDDIRVDMLSRLHLLELIELRAKGWKGTDGMNMYYKKKLNQCSQVDLTDSITSLSDSMTSVLTLNSSPPLLGPGEVIKPSGKFAKPTRIPGKKYCKDEVVIRNADSGKGGERTPYTNNEKLLLASLVDKHKNVLENKKTDASTLQEKYQEWEKVAAEYNAQASLINIKRTPVQLKKLWNNLKQRKRKATTELKYKRLLTGGGPEPPEEQDPVMEAVSIAAPHVDVTLPCPWDSTGVYEASHAEQKSEVSTEYEVVKEIVAVQQVEDEPEELLSPSTSAYTGKGTQRTPTASMATPRVTPSTSTETDPAQSALPNPSSRTVNPGAKERLVQITGASEESINHAKQLIEDTIRRNASPVREGSSGVGGPLTGSSSSINSSASDDSALPSSARVSRALMHSLSTPDANFGEYKYTVITNGHTIKITGDNLDLVRTSKLVLDEYFSGEPIHDVAQFYSFDSLLQPLLPDEIGNPLSPPESIPSPGPLLNGQPGSVPVTTVASNATSKDETANEEPKIRKPHLSTEDGLKMSKRSPDKEGSPKTVNTTKFAYPKSHLTYSIEILAQLAMSPLCLTEPSEWERIIKEYPVLVRKVVQCFDAKRYLSIRTEEPSGVLNAEDDVDD